MEKVRRRFPIWLRIAYGLLALAAMLVVAAVGLRFWITSDGGRAFVASQIDGRRLGPLGAVRISGLEGDPLDAATVADIALVDDDGVWLRARDVRIEWTPTALFMGDLQIRKVLVRTVDVLRAPKVANVDESAPGPDIGLRLDEVSIGDLRLAEPVIGVEARYALTGAAASPRQGDSFARLTLTPTEGPADHANLSLDWSATGALKGLANVGGPADGLIAALVQSPDGQAVGFVGDIAGTLDRFASRGTLSFGGAPAATFALTRAGDQARFTGELFDQPWPLLESLTAMTGPNIRLSGEATLTDLAAAPVTLQINAPAGSLRLAGAADLNEFAPAGPVAIVATGLDLARLAPPLAGAARAEGNLTLEGLTGFVWNGEVSASGLSGPGGSATSAAGPIRITKNGQTISWRSGGLTIEGARLDALPDLAPARYTAETGGEFNLRTGVVELLQSQLQGKAGAVTARGSYATRTGAMDLTGSARIVRLQDFADVSGSAQAKWTARRTSETAPIRLSVEADGRGLSSGIEGFSQLIGASPRVTFAGVAQRGRFVIESGALDAAGVRATLSGRVSDSGEITGTATGALRRSVTIGGAAFENAAFRARMSGDMWAPVVDITLSEADIAAGGVAITGLGGRSLLRFGEAITGDFRLAGETSGQALQLTGRIEAGEGDARLRNVSISLGEIRANIPRLAFTDGGLSTTFTAAGSLAGLPGITKGGLNATGSIALGEALAIDVSGRLTGIETGETRIELATFDATSRGEAVSVTSKARGVAGVPFELTLTGSGRRDGPSWAGIASLDGKLDDAPVTTPRPAAWRIDPDGWSVDAAAAGLGGALEARASMTGDVARLTATLEGVRLRAITRLLRMTPATGDVSGNISFVNERGRATGDAALKLANANPAGVTANPVSIDVSAQLRDGVLQSVATGSGQGFSLDAKSSIPIAAGSGFDLAVREDGAMNSDLSLVGRAEQVWALFGPENQSLRGELRADVRATGTPSQPILVGGFAIADGAYEHGETGLALRDIEARGEFDQRTARVTSLTANDGKGGSLIGQGAIDWTGDTSGKLSFTANNLRAMGRDDRFAIVSGDGALTLDSEAIAVTGNIAVSEARISVEQPAAASIPTLPGLRRVNFPNQPAASVSTSTPPWLRPVQLDLRVTAQRRIVVFGRGLDTEWAADVRVTGPVSDPSIAGVATLERGSLDLGGRRFQFDSGTITLDGPIRLARINISADRVADGITARVRVTGTPVEPKFTLESTPSLPQDEVLARVLFGRSAAQLSGLEAAQLAAGLAQLAGGQAGFDPLGLVRQATGLDRVSVGAEGGVATVTAGKYIADNVYVQVGAGGEGGVGAEVEWEPADGVSIISSADGNGDTKIAVRWKHDY